MSAASIGTSWARWSTSFPPRRRPPFPPEFPQDSVTVAATGGNTLAVGNVELRFPSPLFKTRLRLATFLDVGGAWQRGVETSRRGHPAHPRLRYPIDHASRPRAAGCRLQSIQAPDRPAVPGGHSGVLSPVPGQETSSSTARTGTRFTSRWDSRSDAQADRAIPVRLLAGIHRCDPRRGDVHDAHPAGPGPAGADRLAHARSDRESAMWRSGRSAARSSTI